MKGVIIAGGLGTRLRPLTNWTPKPIVPVANRPFILYQIDLLRRHGITEVILNLHYLSREIKKLLGDGRKYGVKIYYSIEREPLGTAGAVKNAEKYFDEEPLLVFNGDVLTDIDLSAVIDFHKKQKSRATITLTRVEDPTSYGLILTNREGVVTSFVEKPSWEQVRRYAEVGPADTINAGIYVLDPKIFRVVPAKMEHSFERQLFPSLLEKGELVCGFISDSYWMDIGKPSQYREAHEAILRGEVKVAVNGKTKNALTLVGKKVRLGKKVKIKEYSVIGDKVSLGDGSVVNNSIIWPGSKIGRHVTLDGCIIGAGCVVEEGSIIGGGVVLADHSVIKKGSIICSK
ncbi:MAG: NDP-sugar synthase [bacterium]